MIVPSEPKIIKNIMVAFSGEPSVGIPHRYYNVEVYIDLNDYDEEDWASLLVETKQKIKEFYSVFEDGEPAVYFDFECEMIEK